VRHLSRAPSTVGVYAGCVDVVADASDQVGAVVVRPKGGSWGRRANSSRMMVVADEWRVRCECSCCESSMQEESFDYEDVGAHHCSTFACVRS
jgi:hypothetical protein